MLRQMLYWVSREPHQRYWSCCMWWNFLSKLNNETQIFEKKYKKQNWATTWYKLSGMLFRCILSTFRSAAEFSYRTPIDEREPGAKIELFLQCRFKVWHNAFNDCWPLFKRVSWGTSQDIVDFLKVVLLWAIAQRDLKLTDFLKSHKLRVGF